MDNNTTPAKVNREVRPKNASSGRRALIIGLGIGGLSAGIALRRTGFDVHIFERRRDRKDLEIGGGIVMWANAGRAMQQLGVADGVLKVGVRVKRAEHRSQYGKLLAVWPMEQIEALQGAPSVSVSRANLHPVLEEALGDIPVRMQAECVGFTQNESTITAQFADGTQEQGDLLVCADGRNSKLRRQVANVDEKYPPYAGYTLWSATAKLKHPAAEEGVFAVMHGGATQVYFFHINPGEVYWSCAAWVPESERGRHFGADNKATVEARLRGWGEPLPSFLRSSQAAEVARRDIYGGMPLARWSVGRVALLGDAAHPMTTTQGQGACAAMEDALVMSRCLQPDQDIVTGLRAYEAQRQERTNTLMKVSKQLEERARISNPARVWIRNQMIGMVFGTPWLVQRLGWYQGMARLV
jgi:2-polyprenyl-6-methoxyphenol hydroxylase-like FAD-dependent oxidoreductase